jgi:predicted metal-binding transcription factor (methanogenesis marker protein 9)
LISTQLRKDEGVISMAKVFCPLCGKEFKDVNMHIRRTHERDPADVAEEVFGHSPKSPETEADVSPLAVSTERARKALENTERRVKDLNETIEARVKEMESTQKRRMDEFNKTMKERIEDRS